MNIDDLQDENDRLRARIKKLEGKPQKTSRAAWKAVVGVFNIVIWLLSFFCLIVAFFAILSQRPL